MKAININGLPGVTMTVTVRLTRRFRFRLAVALLLLRAAALVCKFGFEVKETHDEV